jgi:hypothetical protein
MGMLTIPYFDSVCSIPHASTFTGGDNDPSMPAELKVLATRVVKETYKHYYLPELRQ